MISKLGGLKHNDLFAYSVGWVQLHSSSIGLSWSHLCSFSDLEFWLELNGPKWPHPHRLVSWEYQRSASVLYMAASAAGFRFLAWQWQSFQEGKSQSASTCQVSACVTFAKCLFGQSKSHDQAQGPRERELCHSVEARYETISVTVCMFCPSNATMHGKLFFKVLNQCKFFMVCLCVWVVVVVEGRRYGNLNRYWIYSPENNYLDFLIKLKIFNSGGLRGVAFWNLGNVISMWSLEKWTQVQRIGSPRLSVSRIY